MLKYRTNKRSMSTTEKKRQLLRIKSVKHHPPLPLLFVICCLSALHISSGFPQSAAHYVDGLDIPESERLAFCFSQWTALPDQPPISNFIMDLCSSIYNRMKVNEENNQEIYKRFLFHYSRAQDPALKTGESHITTEEFTKKRTVGGLFSKYISFVLPWAEDCIQCYQGCLRKTQHAVPLIRDNGFYAELNSVMDEECMDSSGTMGRPFFLFRPRNGRKVSLEEQ